MTDIFTAILAVILIVISFFFEKEAILHKSGGNSIRSTWARVEEAGYQVRSVLGDGQKAWQPFKAEFSASEQSWPSVDMTRLGVPDDCEYQRGKTDDDVVIKIGDETLDNSKETDHFFVQHLRISHLSTPVIPLVKVMQIAYNAGQYRAAVNESAYSSKVKEYYDVHKLGSIDTYIKCKSDA